MLIAEILYCNNQSAEGDSPSLQLNLPPPQFTGDPTNLANAFTRRGLVKYLWNLNGSAGQPSGPAPPGAEPELTPTGAVEPTTASLQAEPVETEPSVDQHRRSCFGTAKGLKRLTVPTL
jgi:hypothetical protein